MKKQILFRECDPAGVLFFGQALPIVHDAFEAWVVSQGILWQDWFNDAETAAPIRHADIEYLIPCRANETFDISIQALAMGTTSFKISFEFVKNSLVHMKGTLTFVFVNKASGQKVPIPKAFQKLLLRESIS